MEHAAVHPPNGHPAPAPAPASTDKSRDPRITEKVYPDAQHEILEELRNLVKLHKQAVPTPPVISEFLYNFLLQIMGLALAAVFGAFSILAWRVSEDASRLAAQANELTTRANDLTSQANELTRQANGMATDASCGDSADNLISIFDFCQASPPSALNETCASLLGSFQDTSSEIVDSFAVWVQRTVSAVDSCFGSATTNTSPPPPPPIATTTAVASSANSGQPMVGAIVGGVIAGLLLAGILFWLKYKTYKSHIKRLKGTIISNSHME